ncbi:38.7K [Perigonia lusca single nucleopolyhedrovirus]|uniref:38.7K n=1 Tax=Perigonia lusca single nucleopolyhedrovirus TaxID=1675865 RepID=A0A0M3WP95_9ABAC|nr:38.7K [Perigonia lusca single nucleopolyhedrovirus]AKN80615.1 38.7K [Perigonia lusca single nucleopolyhedrovirus]
MFEFISKWFSYLTGDKGNSDHDHENRKKGFATQIAANKKPCFTYLLKEHNVNVADCDESEKVIHPIRYTRKLNETWVVAKDVLKIIAVKNHLFKFVDDTTIGMYVNQVNMKGLNEILWNTIGGIKCINHEGCEQLLNKGLNGKYQPLQNSITELFKGNENGGNNSNDDTTNKSKLCEIIVGSIEKNNKAIVDNINSSLSKFEHQLSELKSKIETFENVQNLYDLLQQHHANVTKNSGDAAAVTTNNLVSPSSFSSVSLFNNNENSSAELAINELFDGHRYETVKFPKDSSKHPRLVVYVKPVDDMATDVTFITGLQQHQRLGKRKYRDMECVYDRVHPNPQMAVYCINEEMNMKNFNYVKRARKMYRVECNVDVMKSFINENL